MATSRKSSDRLVVFLSLALVCLAGAAHASIDLSILPAQMVQQPGDTVVVELTVVNQSDEFNAYDARVTYDPQRLQFLRLSPVAAQEGPLMTQACGTRFHIFTIAPDSTYLQVNHSLLCAGTSVTGPGVVYRLKFRCRDIQGQAALGFGSPTAFYDGGLYVNPVHLAGAVIEIGGFTATPDAAALEAGLTAAPNPFNPRTTLGFDLPVPAGARLAIFDLLGRRIRTVAAGELGAGHHDVVWDGRDDAGQAVATGTYLARLEAGAVHDVRRLVLVR